MYNMTHIATYGTLGAAKQVMTKRRNENIDPQIKYLILPSDRGFQLWSYTQGEQK